MAQSTGNTTELTAEQVITSLVTPLEAASTFLAAGPTVYDTAGPLRIPKAPALSTDELAWVGENELIPERETAFEELRLLPSTMKSIKTITRYSNELARQSVTNLEAAIQSRMVADVAAKIDEQLWSDEGDGVETPRGLFAYPGVQTVTGSGALTLDTILEAQGLALEANVNVGALRLAIRPSDLTALRGLTDGDNRYMLQPDATQGSIGQILGTPVIVSARIPEGKSALVDFSQVAVARDLAPTVKILTERYADYDQQAIRVVTRYDAGPLNDEAIVVIDRSGE